MNRKSGIILGIALIVFLVISILGAALMTIVMGQAKQANDLEKRTQAYFLARSGVEIAREYVDKIDKDALENKILVLYGNLRDDDDYSYDFNIRDVTNIWSNDVRASFEASSSSFRNYEVVTAIWKDDDFTNFISSGNAGDMSRTVAFKYSVAVSSGGGTIPEFDMAVFAKTDFEITNGSIVGSIGTESTVAGSVRIMNGSITGGINVGPNGDTGVGYWSGNKNKGFSVNEGAVVQSEEWIWNQWLKFRTIGTLSEPRNYTLPDIPSLYPDPVFQSFPVQSSMKQHSAINGSRSKTTVTEEGYFPSILINGEVEVDLRGNQSFTMLTESFKLNNDGPFTVKGPGRLDLFVNDNFSTVDYGSIRLTDGAELYIHVNGSFEVGCNMSATGLYVNSNSSFLHKNGKLSILEEAIIKSSSFKSRGGGEIDLHGGKFEVHTSDFFEIDDGRSIKNIGTGIVRARNLEIKNGHISLSSGSDKSLILFAENTYSMGSDSSINNSNEDEAAKRVALYYYGSSPVTIGGGQTFIGTVHIGSPEAQLNMTEGGKIVGTIITASEDVIISGGSQANVTAVYAPNAHVEHNNGTVNGAIVCDTYAMSGGASVNRLGDFDPTDFVFPGSFNGTSDQNSEAFELWGE